MQAPPNAEEEEMLRLMSMSRGQSRARFEAQTGYAAAGGSAVQEHIGRGRTDLSYGGLEPEMSGGVAQVVSQDVAPAVAGGARGTRKNFFRYVCSLCHASQHTC